MKRFRPIIQKLSDDTDVPVKDIEEMIDVFFETMKRYITDPRMPSIKITNFGTFKPKLGKINWHIKRTITFIRSGVVKDWHRPKIKHLWQIRRRLMDEKKGVLTWKSWRNKKLDIFKEQKEENAKK